MKLHSLVSSIITAVLFLLFIFLGQVVFAATGTNTFTEQFINQTYRDSTYTTALWASGNYTLQLPASNATAQLNPSVSLDGSSYVAVWLDKRNGVREIYAAKYSSSGTKVWGDLKVNQYSVGTPPTGIEPAPKVFCYGGYTYILYAANSGALYLQKHYSDGSLVWSAQVASSTSWNEYDVAVSNSYGYIYVAYTAGSSAYISKYNSSGTKLWGPSLAHNSGSAYDVSVAVYGDYVYVAHRSTTAGTQGSLDICKINPSTGARSWTTDTVVATGNQIRIGADTYGNVCVTFDSGYSIYYTKYNYNAYKMISSILVSSGALGAEQTAPEFSVGAGNIKYIIWLDKYNTGSYGYDIRVKGQKMNSSDIAIYASGGVQVSHNDISPQRTPSVCPIYTTSPASNSGIFAVWGDDTSGLSNIMANSTTTGARVWTNDICINNAPEYSSTAQGQSLTIDTVSDPVNAATLTYNTITSDNGTTTLNVFGQTYSLFGQTAVYYLSNNGGTNWYQVTPGVKFTFPVSGSNLRFKVVLSSTNRSIQTKLEDITITYDYNGDTSAPTGVPSTPTDQGTYYNSTTLIFNWTLGTAADPESGIVGYYLQVASDSGFVNLKYNGDVGNVLTKSITGCVQGTTYYARVRAKNGVSLFTSYSGTSNGIKVDTTAPSGTPATPTDAGATSTSSTITFNWTAGTLADAESGISGYWLQVSTDTTFATQFYSANVGNVTSKAVSGARSGLTYYARVRAANGSGIYSAYSGISDGILIQIPDTTPPTGTPSVPVDQGAVISSTSLVFNWTLGTAADLETGIVGYYLQVASDVGFTNLLFNADIGNVLTHTVNNAVNGSTYYARVRAKNGAGLYGNYSSASDGITVQISSGSFIVYSDNAWAYGFAYDGTYGGTSITMDPACTTTPAQGTTCTKFMYDKTKEGYAWVWNVFNGMWGPGTNLTGNTKLTFKARSDVAGVKLNFGMGLYASGDTTSKEFPGNTVALSTSWTTYTIDLTGCDLSSINSFWYFSINGSIDNPTISNPVTFYVDDVKYSNSTTSPVSMYAPSADFTEGETYVYPNPAKEGKKPTIHVEVGWADKVNLYLYDVAGDLQESVELTDAPSVVDDKYAYEYQWDATDKASGVYIARIIATKGSDKLKITRKFAVVK